MMNYHVLGGPNFEYDTYGLRDKRALIKILEAQLYGIDISNDLELQDAMRRFAPNNEIGEFINTINELLSARHEATQQQEKSADERIVELSRLLGI